MKNITIIILSFLLLSCSGAGLAPKSNPIDSEGQSDRPPYGMYCMCRDKPQFKELLMCKQVNEKMAKLNSWERDRYDSYCDRFKEDRHAN